MKKANFIKDSIHFVAPDSRRPDELKIGDRAYLAFIPHALRIGLTISDKQGDYFILEGARMSADSNALYKNKNEAIDATIKLLLELKE